jgi:hypothetical protein
MDEYIRNFKEVNDITIRLENKLNSLEQEIIRLNNRNKIACENLSEQININKIERENFIKQINCLNNIKFSTIEDIEKENYYIDSELSEVSSNYSIDKYENIKNTEKKKKKNKKKCKSKNNKFVENKEKLIYKFIILFLIFFVIFYFCLEYIFELIKIWIIYI